MRTPGWCGGPGADSNKHADADADEHAHVGGARQATKDASEPQHNKLDVTEEKVFTPWGHNSHLKLVEPA